MPPASRGHEVRLLLGASLLAFDMWTSSFFEEEIYNVDMAIHASYVEWCAAHQVLLIQLMLWVRYRSQMLLHVAFQFFLHLFDSRTFCNKIEEAFFVSHYLYWVPSEVMMRH